MCVCVCVCCKVLEGHKGHGGAQERGSMRAVMVKWHHVATTWVHVCVKGSGTSLGVETGDVINIKTVWLGKYECVSAKASESKQAVVQFFFYVLRYPPTHPTTQKTPLVHIINVV